MSPLGNPCHSNESRPRIRLTPAQPTFGVSLAIGSQKLIPVRRKMVIDSRKKLSMMDCSSVHRIEFKCTWATYITVTTPGPRHPRIYNRTWVLRTHKGRVQLWTLENQLVYFNKGLKSHKGPGLDPRTRTRGKLFLAYH